jgi:hypothetical protein
MRKSPVATVIRRVKPVPREPRNIPRREPAAPRTQPYPGLRAASSQTPSRPRGAARRVA